MPNNYILTSSGSFISEEELYHHGIKGMKWGVRRYQNEDGSLTAAGKKRWDGETAKQKSKELDKKRSDYKRKKYAYSEAMADYRRVDHMAYSPFKYARDYANDSRKNASKAYDDMTSARKDYKNAKKEFRKNASVGQKMSRTARKAPEAVASAMGTIGALYLGDRIFNDGKGAKAAKNAIQVIGMAVITANAVRRGDTDITWKVKGR